jgi:hypothetical protein
MENKYKLVVRKEFRTNQQSLVPGGSTVEVHFEKRIKVYDNIKNPTAYIKAIKVMNADKDEKINATYVDGKKTKHVWETTK